MRDSSIRSLGRSVLWLLLILVPAKAGHAAASDLSGTAVTVAADADDDVGVVGVQFFLNGEPLGPEDLTAPYAVTWDTTSVSDGLYTITAVARDAAGNEGISTPVTVTVNNSSGVDTTAPTVITTSPSDGSTVSSIVSASASASDNLGVVGVQFYVDGAPLGPEDTVSPYMATWDTTLFANGAHVLSARARDGAGNLAFSAGVTIFVSNSVGGDLQTDTSPPTIETTSPANASTVSASVAVTASANDNVGVVGVQFFVDGNLLGSEDLAAPYAVTWNTSAVPDGVHTLFASARDAAGNETFSQSVTVTVSNSPSPDSPAEQDPSDPAPSVEGNVGLSIEVAGPGFRTIRANSDVGDELQLYVDGQEVTSVSGREMAFEWDIRPLVGSHEVRVVAMVGPDVVASTSLFFPVASIRVPTVTLDVVELPLIRATAIRASADAAGAVRLELYIDGDLAMTRSGATQLEYAWDPGNEVHQLLFAAYDALGVVASVRATYGP